MLLPGNDALGHATYARHRPEQTLMDVLLYRRYIVLKTS